MATKWLEDFINTLERLLDKPPYLLFVFISSVFVIITLLTHINFEQTWAFFIYSAVGTVWRYMERDFIRPMDKLKFGNTLLRIIYHIGNLGLLTGLIYYLNSI